MKKLFFITGLTFATVVAQTGNTSSWQDGRYVFSKSNTTMCETWTNVQRELAKNSPEIEFKETGMEEFCPAMY